ncbi:hypothetical protein CWM58_20660 [Klebsiella sp. H-Nf2]|nr:hypothetical protein CWM58_20660 [Klebsiella sp. H-Nf2]
MYLHENRPTKRTSEMGRALRANIQVIYLVIKTNICYKLEKPTKITNGESISIHRKQPNRNYLH